MVPQSAVLVDSAGHELALGTPTPPAVDDHVPAGSAMEMFERLARDPDASVDKIERLMALMERREARTAETAFNAALSAAQQEMRPVAADAENPQTRSRYASYEALDRVLRPIYTKHGFALSFNTGDPDVAEYVRVLCDVTHLAGHRKPYKIDMPADGKGAKGGDVMTKTHAVGSGVSYGMRYLLKMIFNVAVGEDDDDGNAASGSKPAPPPPRGFDDWWHDMEAVADEGFTRLEQAWGASSGACKTYARTHRLEQWNALKAKAMRVRS